MPVLTEAREDHKLELATEVLRSGSSIRMHALGTSMLPSIWPGNVLSIAPKSGEEIVPGDIVLVVRDGRFFVHRLIDKRNPHWITRGDSMPQNDEAVAEDQVLGKVSLIYRKSGVTVPSSRVSTLARILGGMLGRSDSFRNLTLRIHSFCQRGMKEPESKCGGRRVLDLNAEGDAII